MLVGRYQTALWTLFLGLGCAIATAFLLREILGLGRTAGVVGWAVVISITLRIVYVDWKRDGDRGPSA